MEVKLIAHTTNPADTVAVAGKGCYSPMPASDIVLDPKDVDHTLEVIHPSCYEHAVFTFSISGISRVTSHQLVRHRMASYSQQSQRYVKPLCGESPLEQSEYTPLFQCVIPESIKNTKYYENKRVAKVMWILNGLYRTLLEEGVPEEDARYLIPQGVTTSIVVTMNARELQHFCGLRRCTRAQWEIREVADKMAQAAEEACPELFRHFSLGPQCEQLGYCPEHKGCGRRAPLDTPLKYEKGTIIMPEYTPEQIKEIAKKVRVAMERCDAIPIVALPTDTTSTYVPGRIAGEMFNEWTNHNTIPIATKEDLARQKERAEDAVAVAKSVVEKPDMPCCPRCGSWLVIEDDPLVIGRDPISCKVGCPQCKVWCGSITKEDALNMFMGYWGKDE